MDLFVIFINKCSKVLKLFTNQIGDLSVVNWFFEGLFRGCPFKQV